MLDSLVGFSEWSDMAVESLETEEERNAVREQILKQKEWVERWGLHPTDAVRL